MHRHPECRYRAELDMQTLVWTRGRAFPLSWLQTCARCEPFRFLTRSGHQSGRNLATQQAPDLMLANPLCCHSGEGQQMPFDRLQRREFITLLGAGGGMAAGGAGAAGNAAGNWYS